MFIQDSEPRELMSEDLQNVLQEEEDIAKAYQESFISIVVLSQEKTDALIGSLVGVQLEENIKLDMKVSIEDAYVFVSKILTNRISKIIPGIILAYGDNSTHIEGSFHAASVKIVELDANSKVCVLAIDLIKQQGT